jgi:hypothetical protein
MTIEHQAPEFRCDLCDVHVQTVHDGDQFRAWERGWGTTNVASPCKPAEWPEDQRAEYERVQSILGYNASLVTDDHIGCHMCPACIATHGINLDSEWPFISASHYRAPEVIPHAV